MQTADYLCLSTSLPVSVCVSVCVCVCVAIKWSKTWGSDTKIAQGLFPITRTRICH